MELQCGGCTPSYLSPPPPPAPPGVRAGSLLSTAATLCGWSYGLLTTQHPDPPFCLDRSETEGLPTGASHSQSLGFGLPSGSSRPSLPNRSQSSPLVRGAKQRGAYRDGVGHGRPPSRPVTGAKQRRAYRDEVGHGRQRRLQAPLFRVRGAGGGWVYGEPPLHLLLGALEQREHIPHAPVHPLVPESSSTLLHGGNLDRFCCEPHCYPNGFLS